MITLKTQLKNIPKITPKYTAVLEKMGLHNVEDLLLYFPFRYDDFSEIALISPENINKVVTIEGIVTKKKLARIFHRKMTIAEITVEDENNIPLKAVWFNQPYILESLPEGSSVRLSGKIALKGKILTMSAPAWERANRDATNTGRLVPVYSETTGITSKWIRWQIKPLLEIAKLMEDPIPYEVRQKFNLYDIYTALTQIHFPDSPEKLLRAQKRFAFSDMLLVQLKTLQVKKQWENNSSLQIKFDEEIIKKFVTTLPFTLTNAQRKASFEILRDLEKSIPMNRLLNGDVGSGKTIVAAIASLQTVSAGFQVAILAPTEVLAKQHFESFCKILGNYPINVALLTNSYQEIKKSEIRNPKSETNPNDKISKSKKLLRENLLKNISNGKINIIIGTHAIIQKGVHFQKLALIIIDEQHRFGVAQRAYLQQETMNVRDGLNKTIPHLLTMTATPIPRTLSIALFGSLEISILDEMPKNRKEIITHLVPPNLRQETYNFIENQIQKGHQAFVIFPLVEESEALSEIKAATTEHQRLSLEIFPNLSLGLLHGKMKSKEKESVMQDFKDKKTDILVATSVVEVGIDIPNATVIVIEDAERFGLSQLHQFRGRVGRSEHQSYCFLFTNSTTEKATDRLQVMEETNDGFEVSQKDLLLRGPGQFFGTLQSGLPDIAMQHLTNIKLIKFSRAEAQNIIDTDPQLKKHPVLKDALQKFQENIHLE